MASFTFGAGNARKLLGLPLYALSAVISLVVPRSDRLWVFGSGIGLGEGALPLYRLARERLGDSTRIVWLARSAAELDEARALGFDTVRKDGMRGFWTTLRARVIVVTHGFGDANRYGVRGGFVVQLWHGLPFKHLHLDSPSTYSVSFLPDLGVVRRMLAFGYRRAGRGISLFPVASERVQPSIVSGFGVDPANVVITGDVRDDVLLADDGAARREQARSRLDDALPDLPPAAHTVLFAPTWRDGAADPTVPTAEEWDAIVAWLDRHDAVLLVRTHPLGRGSYADGPARSPRIRLLGADLLRDVNPVLWAVDVVITDYSSIVFDFALVGRPVVFYAPDLDTYTSSRGFYLSFEEFTGGRAVTTWAATLDRLGAAIAEDEEGPAHRHARHLRQEFFDILDGHAGDRVLDAIIGRTGTGPAPFTSTLHPLVHRPAVTGLGFDEGTAALSIEIESDVSGAALVGRRARVDARGSAVRPTRLPMGIGSPSAPDRHVPPRASGRIDPGHGLHGTARDSSPALPCDGARGLPAGWSSTSGRRWTTTSAVLPHSERLSGRTAVTLRRPKTRSSSRAIADARRPATRGGSTEPSPRCGRRRGAIGAWSTDRCRFRTDPSA